MTRCVIDLSKLLDIFEKYSVEFVSVQEKIETNTPQGRFFMYLIVLVAQWEVEANKERTQRGVRKSAMLGNYAKTRTPLGYDRVNKKLVINERRVNLVRSIFDMFVTNDYSMNQIALYLDSIKALNVRWDDKKIKAILVNSIYKGLYESDDIYIENHSPAIIEEVYLIKLNKS